MERIYYNGKIITMEAPTGKEALTGAPEAILVKDGMINAVGKLSDVKSASGGNVEMVDLDGKCLVPGFIDAHSHISTNGRISCCAYLGDCASYDDIISTLRSYLAAHPVKEGGALIGYSYDHNFLREGGQPDKRVLDQVSKDIPIFILHVSMHLGCANSKTLEICGITSSTPNPQGGLIGRLPGGNEPSGYLEEAGFHLIQEEMLKRAEPDFSEIVTNMQESYLRNGVTTVQDGATARSDLETLKEIARMGKLKLDVISYPIMSSGGEKLLHENSDLCGTYRNRLKIGGYKLILDGSPQGRSAWMSQPYLGGDPDYCGYPWLSDEDAEHYMTVAVEEGRQILVHCNGDAASEQYLDIYEKVLAKTGSKRDLRPVMIHCQTVRNDQLDRMAKIHMIASIFVGHVYYWGDVHMRNFGSARGNHISPVADALKRGITVTFHQDTPVTPPQMLHSVWCAVNRLSRNGVCIGADQKVPVYEALKAVTRNAAYQYFEEGSKGTLSPGKRADLVILDRSPLEVEPMDLRHIKVLETIKDGETVFKLN